jgi:hypothetical protein
MSGPWKIEGDIARLRIGPLTAQLDLKFPQRGLHHVALRDISVADGPAKFLGVNTLPPETPEQIQDCYIRANDLVVALAETPERNIRPQLYWRAFAFPEEASQAFGVDLIISTQTSKLYSDPTLFVESHMSVVGEQSAMGLASDAGPLLFRLNPPAWSFAQAVHPSDFDEAQATVDAHGRGTVRHRLFAPGLEKGVIRRARVRGLFLPRARDEELAAASYAAFVTQELPLTT